MRYLLTLILLLSIQLLQAAAPVQMQSPGKVLQATLLVRNGQLCYQLQAGSRMLIETSPLGIHINNLLLGTQVEQVVLSHQYTIDETDATRLNAAQTVNHGTGYVFAVQEPQVAYTIEFRLYDNGCAFRYSTDAADSQQVKEELTTFTLPAAARVWYFERNNSWKLQSYAGLWMEAPIEKLQTISSQGPVQGKPLVAMLSSQAYVVLTEAALYQYSGMRLQARGRSLQVNFTEGAKGFTVKGPVKTPWRVILYATDLNGLVNNHVIEYLNPQPDRQLFADRSYIQPGRSVWSWITRKANYMQPDEEKRLIDAAAALHFEYTLLDEGWETLWPQKWQQLQEIVQYARNRRVKVWVWKHSKDLRDTAQRNAFLDSVAMTGVAGIKTDFMNSEAKPLIDFEEGFLQAMARRKLMVNFHGCQAPTGEYKTYPNEMTREGIRGMELNIMKEPIPAWHNAALPFTRFLCGHGDYTPGLFSNKGVTTYTHQLALLYLFNSPFQCIAENPVTLLQDDKYKPVLPLLQTLPVTWDETIVLPGSAIGQLAAFARRKGDMWYIAVINGADSAVAFYLKPSFLDRGKIYDATVVTDLANDAGFAVHYTTIQSSRQQSYTLPPAGGLVLAVKRK